MMGGLTALVSQQTPATPADDLQEEQEQLLLSILQNINYPTGFRHLPFLFKGNYFNFVSNVDELLDVFRLRYNAYSKVGYINPDNYPLGMEFDKYDSVSVHLVARNNKTKELTGYSRLIRDTLLGMHVDNLIDISDIRDQYALGEMSRWISNPPRQPHVSRGVRYVTFRCAHELGMQKIVGISLERDEEKFTHIGFVPMIPRKTCPFEYEKSFDPLLKNQTMYGNILHLDSFEEHIESLRR